MTLPDEREIPAFITRTMPLPLPDQPWISNRRFVLIDRDCFLTFVRQACGIRQETEVIIEEGMTLYYKKSGGRNM